jgi:hypothetical protein
MTLAEQILAALDVVATGPERLPGVVLRDLKAKCASDVVRTMKQTAFLADHNEDQLAIVMAGLLAAVGAVTAQRQIIAGVRDPKPTAEQMQHVAALVLSELAVQAIERDSAELRRDHRRTPASQQRAPHPGARSRDDPRAHRTAGAVDRRVGGLPVRRRVGSARRAQGRGAAGAVGA